jgi:hypothetical protein
MFSDDDGGQSDDQHIRELVAEISPFPPGVLNAVQTVFHADDVRFGDIHRFLPMDIFVIFCSNFCLSVPFRSSFT